MASTEADFRLARVVIPSLDKIIKNASWRKHSKLAHECKSLNLLLRSPDADAAASSPHADSDSGSSLPVSLHDGSSTSLLHVSSLQPLHLRVGLSASSCSLHYTGIGVSHRLQVKIPEMRRIVQQQWLVSTYFHFQSSKFLIMFKYASNS
ncbi:Uncharacterized protein Rs2_01381 [Raphanus sativus]|nr:Uncharacterized protein Rs2_01381 [Raphanus sativus]